MPRVDLLQLRGDTAANWTSTNPVLALREPGIETDTRKTKYGDGVTAWNSLAYTDAGGSVASVTGTTNRITSSGGTTPVIDINSAYDAAITAEIAAAIAPFVLDLATPSTAGATITLDMNSQIQRMHVGSASFATAKTIAMSNTTNSLLFNLFINITDVAAVLTVPADWFMSDIQFDGAAWTPPETGRFELGGSFDGTNWWVKIQGPFS